MNVLIYLVFLFVIVVYLVIWIVYQISFVKVNKLFVLWFSRLFEYVINSSLLKKFCEGGYLYVLQYFKLFVQFMDKFC